MAKNYSYHRKTITMPDGSRKDFYGKTKAEVEAKVIKAQILVNAGVNPAIKVTFGEFSQMWYETYKEPLLRENSKNALRNTLNNHILPYLGSYPINSITPMQIQQLMNRLAGKSYSLQAKVLGTLKTIFIVAQENGLITRSPVSSTLSAGGQKPSEVIPLTPDECSILLEKVTNPRARTFLIIVLHTGMRRGEIIALHWSDVDFENQVIHVRHNAELTQRGTNITNTPKTDAGTRDIPMTDELKAHLLAEKKFSRSRYVITMRNGAPLTINAYKSMWRMIERELPHREFTAHTLRHTYITRLFEAGLDIKEVQYLAGHRDVKTTMQIYTHYDRASRAAATAAKVRKALSTSP